jgi:hypothetical protein
MSLGSKHILIVCLTTTCSGCRENEQLTTPVKATQTLTARPPQASMKPDVLYIEHIHDGLEMFKVVTGRCNLRKAEGEVWEFTVVVQSGEAIQRSEELARVQNTKPHFEATAILQPHDLALKPGRVITQMDSFDRIRQVNLSNYYYWGHDSIVGLKVELIEVSDDWIDALITGTVVVHGFSIDNPEARLSVRTKLRRDNELRRGVQ